MLVFGPAFIYYYVSTSIEAGEVGSDFSMTVDERCGKQDASFGFSVNRCQLEELPPSRKVFQVPMMAIRNVRERRDGFEARAEVSVGKKRRVTVRGKS